MNVIDKARELIEREGWCQHAARDGHGRLCIVGAMSTVAPELDVNISAPYKAIAAEADQVTGYLRGGIVRFNDDPSTTLEDVLLVMKRASARLDEEAAS